MGMFGAILIRAVFERTWAAIIWAVVIILFYGSSIILSLLPGQTVDGYYVSWQAHLFGLLAGVERSVSASVKAVFVCFGPFRSLLKLSKVG